METITGSDRMTIEIKSEFKVKMKKTQTDHEIIIQQYYNGKKISEVSIIGNNENEKHNRENIGKIVYLLSELMRTNDSFQNQLIFLQDRIDQLIKQQKTTIGQNALKQLKSDYNDYMLGHREDSK